jgi:phosphoribosylformimino-5-aminoimidazole carboxamide ribotide isomerase
VTSMAVPRARVIPCIDVMGGKVVQLVKGERKAIELASEDEALDLFKGFPLLHIIDLDAAKGEGDNHSLIQRMLPGVAARVGGGVRSLERAKELLDVGAHQVIIGSAAFAGEEVNHDLLREIGATIGPDKVVVAIDCKGGAVAISGWREVVPVTPAAAIKELEPYCSGFLCTYVDKEGMLEGTDLDLFLSLRKLTKRGLTAAGGISTMHEVQTLLQAGIDVALGMAIYTGRLDLEELRAL